MRTLSAIFQRQPRIRIPCEQVVTVIDGGDEATPRRVRSWLCASGCRGPTNRAQLAQQRLISPGCDILVQAGPWPLLAPCAESSFRVTSRR